jgi:DNA polymerase-3 subunit epsilon
VRPDRHSYLERRGESWAVVSKPGRFGPLSSKRRAQLAARALADFEGEDLEAALPPLRAKLRRLASELRFEDAARLRDRVRALEEVTGRIAELDRLRASRLCLLAPAREPGFQRAFLVVRGRVVERTVPAGPGGRIELDAGLAVASAAEVSFAPEDAAALVVVAGVLRRPPPEVRVVSPDGAVTLAA